MRRWMLICLIALVAAVAVALWMMGGRTQEIAENSPPPAETQDSSVANSTFETLAPELTEPPFSMGIQASDEHRAAPAVSVPTELNPNRWEARVTGRVTDENGNPIAEAQVTANTFESAIDEILTLAQTDFSGCYEITLPLNPSSDLDRALVRVTARAPGYASGVNMVRLSRSMPVSVADITLFRGEALAGRVEWASGDPVPHARLVFRGVRSEGSLAFGETDATGRFRVDGLAPGRVIAAVSPDGGPYQGSGPVTVGDEDVVITLLPRIGVVTGQVVTGLTRQPVPGHVVWLGDNVSGYDAWIASTDSEGRFQFDEIPLEYWRIQGPDLPGVSCFVELSEENPIADFTIEIPEPLDLTGTLIDAATQEPVAGITISAVGLSSADLPLGTPVPDVTDSEGRFAMSDVPVAEAEAIPLIAGPIRDGITIQFELTGESWLFVADNQPRTTITFLSVMEAENLELTIANGIPLEITAVDPTGTPIPGIAMTMHATDPRVRMTGETDANGHVTLIRPPGTQTCQITGSSRDWPAVISPVVPLDQMSVIATAFDRTALAVRVVDSADHSVPEAAVSPRIDVRPLGRSTFHSTYPIRDRTTDRAGIARFLNLPRCPLEISASEYRLLEGGGMRTETIAVDLGAADAPDEVTIQLEDDSEVTVRGRVVDVRESPIAGAQVVAWMRHQSDNPTNAITDAEGRFELEDFASVLQGGLRATAVGHLPGFEGWRVGDDDEVIIRLQPGFTIRGRVIREDGTAAASGDVLAFKPTTRESVMVILQPSQEGWNLVRTASLEEIQEGGEAGRFEWALARNLDDTLPYPAWIMVITPDRRVATADLMITPETQIEYDVGIMTLGPGITLSGRVIDPAGEGIVDAVVQWETGGSQRGQQVSTRWRDATGASGLFRLNPLPPGHWRIHVMGPGYAPETFEIDLAEDMERDFVLTPIESASVNVRVISPNGEAFVSAHSSIGAPDQQYVSVLGTDLNGWARHRGVPMGEYTHRLFLPTGSTTGTATQRLVIDEPVDRVEIIDMREWLTLAGRIVVTDGSEMPGALDVMGESHESDEALIFNGGGHVDSEGRFEVHLPPGHYALHCQSRTESIHLTADRTDLEIVLTPE